MVRGFGEVYRLGTVILKCEETDRQKNANVLNNVFIILYMLRNKRVQKTREGGNELLPSVP